MESNPTEVALMKGQTKESICQREIGGLPSQEIELIKNLKKTLNGTV